MENIMSKIKAMRENNNQEILPPDNMKNIRANKIEEIYNHHNIKNLAENNPNNTQNLNTLPNGQNINVITNHNIHLERNEWLFRGVVGGIGKVLAFPFRLLEKMITSIFEAIFGMLKTAIIILLVPTLIWAGIILQQKMSQQENIEDGTQLLVDQASEVVSGTKKAIEKKAE